MTRGPGMSEFDYKYLFLDVKGMQLLHIVFLLFQQLTNTGYPRLFLENTDVQTDSSKKGTKGTKPKFLGIQWGW
jgi:hypothetical protein